MNKNTPYRLCFETLSNDLRLQILRRLKKSPCSVSELCKETGEEQSKISHSLSTLRTCNYVRVSQDGKKRIYSLHPSLAKGLKGKKSNATIFDWVDLHKTSCCNLKCKKA
ncbi:MAG: winged helix-turn-helix domain-containing protein [Candidatus Micrarchaeota archaeon]